MCTDDFFCVFGEHQIADLGTCVNAVKKSAVEGVPKFDCFIGWASTAGQNSMIMGTPGYAFNGCAVVAKFADGRWTVGAPYEQFIVVAAWGEEITVERPL